MAHAATDQPVPSAGLPQEPTAPLGSDIRNTVHWLRVLLAASILVPALLFTFATIEDRDLELKGAEERALKTVGVLHEHARNVFRTHEILISEIDDRIQGMDWDAIEHSQALHRYLAKLSADIDVAQSVWLIDAAGRHRSNSQDFPAVAFDVSERDYFKMLEKEDAGTVISAPYVGKANGILAFSISRRRSSPDHRFDGILSIAIAPSYFADFYTGILGGTDRCISLIRTDGMILAGSRPFKAGSDTYGPQTALMQHLGEADEGVFTAPGADGIVRIYAYEKIWGFPAFVVFGIERATVLARWYRWVILYGLFAAAASAGMFAVTWIALKRARLEDLAIRRMHQEMERREAAERDRLATENQLRQAQKMEAIGQLTGGIAHDFNNLLTVVIGNLEFVMPKLEPDTPIARRLAAAQNAAERGTTLTKQLLAFARRQSLRPEMVDLHASIAAIASLVESSLQSRIQVTTDFAADLWPIKADREQLELAILNVAVNARDAMPHGGTLQIRAGNIVFTGRREGSACGLDGDFVALTISDTGRGIAPETLKRVFEPFFTTKEVGKGTGLGLSQVYGFARQSGGKAAISSVVGKGTAVTLYLPRGTDAEPAAASRQDRVRAPHRSCGTILVVEDEAPVAELAITILEERGFVVRHAANARSALALLDNAQSDGGAEIDLVFSDIVMPGDMSGIELGHAIRRSRPHLPVLLTTGYSDAVKEASRGAFAILYKPYRPADLLAAVDHCFETARADRTAAVGGEPAAPPPVPPPPMPASAAEHSAMMSDSPG
jgi:two-component system, NtrC family, sensor kinase